MLPGTGYQARKSVRVPGVPVALIVSRRGHTVLAYEYISSARALDLVMDRTIVGKTQLLLEEVYILILQCAPVHLPE